MWSMYYQNIKNDVKYYVKYGEVKFKMKIDNLHLQNSECLSSEPSIQWCTVSQTRSSLMQVLVLEH